MIFIQIFRDSKQNIADVYNVNYIFLIKKAPKLDWTSTLSLKIRCIFHGFFVYLFLKNIKTCNAKMFLFTRTFVGYQEKGLTPQTKDS